MRYGFTESCQIKISLCSKNRDDSETLKHLGLLLGVTLFRKNPTHKACLVFMRSDNGKLALEAVQHRRAKAGIVSEFTCSYTSNKME